MAASTKNSVFWTTVLFVLTCQVSTSTGRVIEGIVGEQVSCGYVRLQASHPSECVKGTLNNMKNVGGTLETCTEPFNGT